MLELASEIETSVRDYATREGVTINELMARTFPLHQPGNGSLTASSTEDPAWAMLRDQISEAEHATPEEISADSAAYRQWQQNVDAPRRATGERLLFPEVPQS